MTRARTAAATYSAVQALLARTLADEADVDAAVADLATVAATVGDHTTTLASHTGSIAANTSAIAAIPASQFTKSYESTEQTITAGGLLTLAHGLGVAPKLITGRLVCQTAEAGYSVGDIIEASLSVNTTSGTTAANAVLFDATNITVRFFSGTSAFIAANKSSGAAASLTNASWKLLVRAYA